MKKLKYILGILLLVTVFAACEDEVGTPNVDSRDFIEVRNSKATVSHDGEYYVLSEYEHPDTIAKYNLEMHVFIVDRPEDAAKMDKLNGAEMVQFTGFGQKTDYRPANTDPHKKHYMILLTAVNAWKEK